MSETFECVWLHFIVLESVREDVFSALKVLEIIANNNCTEQLLALPQELFLQHGEHFDAPSYLFFSKRNDSPDIAPSCWRAV